MSEKIWKIIDKVFMYNTIGLNLVYIMFININHNNINVGVSTLISLSYILHILQEQLNHKCANNMQEGK